MRELKQGVTRCPWSLNLFLIHLDGGAKTSLALVILDLLEMSDSGF